ncbi:intermembrane phospholipid transport protein YdbH family protein [Halopseudomonas pelagia]|uniref:intermembrane phospholipid transport protein YdbH family protein n=1 Tax=Halopseudomonas pelagia TaxID=553151 RepID=UPI00039EF32B|nr:YdbH domain-containing protein [Halopseudomonas pelagia]
MRKALSIVVGLVCLILLLMAVAVFLAQRALTAAGVEQLDWQGLRLDHSGLQIEQLSGRYRDQQGLLGFQFGELTVRLGGESPLRLAALEVQNLALDWQPGATLAQEDAGAVPDPLAWAQQLAWLPDRVQVEQLQVRLPCAAGHCTAEGQLQLSRAEAERFVSRVVLRAAEGTLELDAQLQPGTDALALQAQLQLSGRPAAVLEGRWSEPEQTPVWEGRLQVLEWPQADWLLTYITPWLGHQNYPFQQLPTGMQADMEWTLAAQVQPLQWTDLFEGQVQLRAEMSLPQPWFWQDVGELQGRLELDLDGDNGRWQLRQGTARLLIEQPAFKVLADLPADLRPTRLNVQIDPQSGSVLDAATAISLEIKGQASGPVELSLAGGIVLASQPQWQAQWQQLMLTGSADRLELEALSLRGIKLQWPLKGKVNAQQLDVQLGSGATLRAASASAPSADMLLATPSLDLSGLQLRTPLDNPQDTIAQGRLNLSAASASHALLKPQGWMLEGQLDYAAERIGWKGVVKGERGLAMDVQFAWPSGGAWQADVALQEVFLRAANPLAATLADWPALLSFASGRLTGQVQAVGSSGLDSLTGQLRLSGGKGIYDRLTFEGMTATAAVSLKGEALLVDFPNLRLQALDPGMPLGPLTFTGDYSATLAAPDKGRIRIKAAQMGMLGGELRLMPTTLVLAEPRQSVIVELAGVELASLFEVYPAEGLSGRGTLDGRLPVSLEAGKLLIDEGQLQAREPGGFLRYRSAKLEDLARTNVGMRQVAAALDDFHYSVLSSDVAYDQDGLLILGLQLQGRNPSLEGGRPIHLNIRLEENVPALLASLQLSGQVSEIIQKRVQERFLQQRLAPAP